MTQPTDDRNTYVAGEAPARVEIDRQFEAAGRAAPPADSAASPAFARPLKAMVR